MKQILAVFVSSLLLCSAALSADYPAGWFQLRNSTAEELLPIYKELCGLELVVDSRVTTAPDKISAFSPELATKADAQKYLETLLLEKAGVVITRLDDKRASVTYNDALPTDNIRKFAHADRVELCFTDAAQITITGSKAREIVHVVTAAKPLPRPNGLPAVFGTALLNTVRFYQGTNYLGLIRTSHGLFSAGDWDAYQSDKEKMDLLIDKPLLEALKESQRKTR